MPNRVHGIVLINHAGTCRGSAAEGASLGTIVGWFTTTTTNAYIRRVQPSGWQPFSRRPWQINYFEYIIRNERAHERIRRYICANPSRWP